MYFSDFANVYHSVSLTVSSHVEYFFWISRPALSTCDDSFTRESNSTVNEDVWLCGRMAEVVAEMAEVVAENKLQLSTSRTELGMVPAPYYEAMQFSVETEMHTRPFGVHQFWFHLPPNYEMRVRVV